MTSITVNDSLPSTDVEDEVVTSHGDFPFPNTARKASQLVAASSRTTLDPFDSVDWNRPIDDSAFHTSPELLSLYGTSVWDAMTEVERIEYSRHETAAIYGAGIWFENALMQVILRHLTTVDVTDPMHRYLLIEVADECRHSTMFGEYIRRAGTPSYPASLPLEPDDSAAARTLSYLLVLAVEELLDFVNRAAMRDERVHSTVREISRLHVLEEARHVAFAKSFLAETWPALSEEDKVVVRATAPALVAEVVKLNVNETVFDTLSIEDGYDIARSNPFHAATVVTGLSKLTGFLADVGIIDDDSAWIELGLLDAALPLD
ncbi:MAG: diiron oxygenase [Ilumatobacter sp.]|uniref:AurF N-oxygenase family protein n=1 Tax=Ilumatobacter sp. TaxID=1967498 RepID=UPI00329849C9